MVKNRRISHLGTDTLIGGGTFREEQDNKEGTILV